MTRRAWIACPVDKERRGKEEKRGAMSGLSAMSGHTALRYAYIDAPPEPHLPFLRILHVDVGASGSVLCDQSARDWPLFFNSEKRHGV